MKGIWRIIFNNGMVADIEFLESGMFYQTGNFYGSWMYCKETGNLALDYYGNILYPMILNSIVTGYKFSGESSLFKLQWHAFKQPNKNISSSKSEQEQPKHTRSGKRY